MYKLTILSIIMMAFAVTFAESGARISFGYQFTSLDAAKRTAEQLGINTSNTNELMLDIHGYSLLASFLRIGGLISGGYYDAKGTPKPEAMSTNEAGVGFGDARIAFLPELYANFGPITVAAGCAMGGGSIITFLKDDNGDNDGEMTFYGFMRPELSAAYDIGPLAFEVGTGYHLPLLGGKGDFWFIHRTSGDKITNEFKSNETGGFFVRFGLVFGSLIKD